MFQKQFLSKVFASDNQKKEKPSVNVGFKTVIVKVFQVSKSKCFKAFIVKVLHRENISKSSQVIVEVPNSDFKVQSRTFEVPPGFGDPQTQAFHKANLPPWDTFGGGLQESLRATEKVAFSQEEFAIFGAPFVFEFLHSEPNLS